MQEGNGNGGNGNAFPPHLTYRQACSYTNLSRQTLWRMLRKGDIEGARIGSSVRISRSSLDRYMAEHGYAPDRFKDT